MLMSFQQLLPQQHQCLDSSQRKHGAITSDLLISSFHPMPLYNIVVAHDMTMLISVCDSFLLFHCSCRGKGRNMHDELLTSFSCMSIEESMEQFT